MKTDAEKLADLQKSHDRLSLIVKLAPALFAHFTSLQGNAQDEFLAKSSTERDAIVADVTKRAEETDKVVYVSKSDGAVYRAKDDARLVEMAKRLDVEAEKVEKSEIRKVAAEVLGGMLGEDATHDYIVRSIRKGGGDAALQEKAIATLTGMKATSRVGKGAQGVGGSDAPTDAGDPADAEEALAKGLEAFCAEQKITKNLWTTGLAAFEKTEKGAALKRALSESLVG